MASPRDPRVVMCVHMFVTADAVKTASFIGDANGVVMPLL